MNEFLSDTAKDYLMDLVNGTSTERRLLTAKDSKPAKPAKPTKRDAPKSPEEYLKSVAFASHTNFTQREGRDSFRTWYDEGLIDPQMKAPVTKTEREKFQIEIDMLRRERQRLERVARENAQDADYYRADSIDQRTSAVLLGQKHRAAMDLLTELTQMEEPDIEAALERIAEMHAAAAKERRNSSWNVGHGGGYGGAAISDGLKAGNQFYWSQGTTTNAVNITGHVSGDFTSNELANRLLRDLGS